MVEAVRRIPVIGNGDVTTPEAARRMLDETGCAGVSIGRGAFYNPWIFRQTQHYLRTGELLPEPTFDERMRVMGRHFDLMIEIFGEELGCRMFRKIAAWYARRLRSGRGFPPPRGHPPHARRFPLGRRRIQGLADAVLR